MKLTINKINFIKCKFNITKEDNGKEIHIFNNKFNEYGVYSKKNNDIENKIKIIINGEIKLNIYKYKFILEGIYIIFYIIDDSLENISCIFNECKFIEEVGFSVVNTKKIIDMSFLFCGCSSLKEIDLSIFNTDFRGMFRGCSLLNNINLSSFNTYNITNMNELFKGCSSLTEINLLSFDTNNVINYLF